MADAHWNQTRFTQLLGIEYPIVQGPFGGMASQHLTATVSNCGGLGSFGALNSSPSAIKDVAAEIRALTAKPFAINLWVSMEDEGAFASGAPAFERSLAAIAPHITALGGTLPSYTPYAPIRFADQVRVLIDERVPVFSFIFGIPPREILDECRAKKIVTIGVATTADEARALADAGVDAIVASGSEAGGHRGSFLRPAEESVTGTFSLVPQVVDAVSVPVIAAGGIADARGIAAALTLGASGVQIGTAFLACDGSGASAAHRAAILGGPVTTGLTRGLTGRLARAIRNDLFNAVSRVDVPILPYPLQRNLMRSLTGAGERAGRPEWTTMWAGQSAELARVTDAGILFRQLVDETSAILD
jgi:nitronate monooxygenase